MSIHAIIAARGGAAAKSRCSAVLSPAQRGELVMAMFADMVDVLLTSSAVDHVHVVTPTPAIAAAALAAGARPVLEAEACGINRAFDRVRSAIRASDPEAVIIVLPGDLPLIDAAEVETALGRLAADGAVLVPASADGGTGALIFHASAPFQFRFGTDSFRRHYEAALKAGLEPLIAPLPSLGLDIDRPEDFDRVLDRGQAGRTARFLLDLHCCTEG